MASSQQQQYRKNGLSPPYSKMQVGTWITLPVLVLQFGIFCTPILPFALSIPITVLFFVLALACFYYGLLASIIDPMDPYLVRHLHEQQHETSSTTTDDEQARNNNTSTSNNLQQHNYIPWLSCIHKQDAYSAGSLSEAEGDDNNTKYCWVCETTVASHSMHCKYCNKCVSNFDHHCQWLNSCVGTANYPYFNRVLWSISAFLLVHISVMLGLVLDIFLKGTSERRSDAWMGDANLSILVAAVNLFFIAFDGVALSLIIQLLVFHVGLQRKGLTTYQFILDDNQKKREARKVAEERKAKRTVAIGLAKRDGNKTLAMRLQAGAYCTLCDPLPKDDVVAEQQRVRQDLSLENADTAAATTSNGDVEVVNGGDASEGLNGNGESARFG